MRAPADGGAPAPVEPAQPAAEPAPANNPPPSQPGPDFSWLPATFVKDGQPDLDAFRQSYEELASYKAQRDEAAAGIPASADEYVLAIPENLSFGELELPEGFAFKLSEDERVQPLLAEMRSVLHKHQLPNEAAGDLLGLMARYEAIHVADHYKAQRAEAEALGPQAQQRIATINRALEAKLPADQVEAIKAATTTANGVRALEKLLTATPISTGPSTPAGPDIENMTPAQRLEYANAQQARRRA